MTALLLPKHAADLRNMGRIARFLQPMLPFDPLPVRRTPGRRTCCACAAHTKLMYIVT